MSPLIHGSARVSFPILFLFASFLVACASSDGGIDFLKNKSLALFIAQIESTYLEPA